MQDGDHQHETTDTPDVSDVLLHDALINDVRVQRGQVQPRYGLNGLECDNYPQKPFIFRKNCGEETLQHVETDCTWQLISNRRQTHKSHRVGSTLVKVPSDFALKTMNFVHKSILTVSGGKKGWNAGNMPVLKLTTTGRTSGQPRECMLTSPIQQGETYVVVASRGGDDHHPAWFVNLRANSTVWVETQSESKHERRARIATSEERDEMWPIIVAKYANYGGYQLKTEREIPLIFLEKV